MFPRSAHSRVDVGLSGGLRRTGLTAASSGDELRRRLLPFMEAANVVGRLPLPFRLYLLKMLLLIMVVSAGMLS